MNFPLGRGGQYRRLVLDFAPGQGTQHRWLPLDFEGHPVRIWAQANLQILFDIDIHIHMHVYIYIYMSYTCTHVCRQL